MRYLVFIFALILLISCKKTHQGDQSENAYAQLASLIDQKDFFKLKDHYKSLEDRLSTEQQLYVEANIHNVFNRPKESNEQIDRLLKLKTDFLKDSTMYQIYKIKLNNHINLYEYEKASRCSETILDRFRHVGDSTELVNIENEYNIWKSLKDVSKQEIIKKGDSDIQMFRDKIGLLNLPLQIGNKKVDFLFDTGANFSVIVRSKVEEYGLTLIPANFYGTSATGEKIQSDLAIADSISFGNILVTNVIFLVIDDEDISFPQIDYFPIGAIGYPVIEALDELKLGKDNNLFIAEEASVYENENFALDMLMPIILVKYKEDSLRFHFDTGATTTSLFPPFYKKYKDELLAKYEKTTFISGSAGGRKSFDGLVIDSIHLSVANTSHTLTDIRLHTDDINSTAEDKYFHGNFGQDYISQFNEMVISFKYSSIDFK